MGQEGQNDTMMEMENISMIIQTGKMASPKKVVVREGTAHSCSLQDLEAKSHNPKMLKCGPCYKTGGME